MVDRESFGAGHFPLVSAVIATYNRAYIISDAVDSILQQTYPHLEIIVVDDGSTDDTAARLEKYGTRIRIISQMNSGPASAWNTGIAASHGEILCFLGSDDIWLPRFVERQVECLERAGNLSPCSVSNCWLQFADGRGATAFEYAELLPRIEEGKWMNPAEVLATRFVQFGQTVAIRREAIQKIGGFDPSLRYLEDYDLAMRLASLGPWGFVGEPLVVWRQSGTNSLSVEACGERLRVAKISVAIRNRALAGIQPREDLIKLKRLLKRTIRYSQWEIWSLQLLARPANWNKVIGRFGLLFARLCTYWLRNSRYYPRLMDATFDDPIR